MIESIDATKCTGCGICVDICPLDTFRMDEKGEKAIIKYPDDCGTCFECELQCRSGAIYVHPFGQELPPVITYMERSENHG